MRALFNRLSQIMVVSILINALSALTKVLVDKTPDAPKWFKVLATIGIMVLAFVLTTLLPVLIVAFLVDVVVYWKKRTTVELGFSKQTVKSTEVLSSYQMLALVELARKNGGWFSILVRESNGRFSVISVSGEFKLPEEEKRCISSILEDSFSRTKGKTFEVYVPMSLGSDDQDVIADRFHIEVVE